MFIRVNKIPVIISGLILLVLESSCAEQKNTENFRTRDVVPVPYTKDLIAEDDIEDETSTSTIIDATGSGFGSGFDAGCAVASSADSILLGESVDVTVTITGTGVVSATLNGLDISSAGIVTEETPNEAGNINYTAVLISEDEDVVTCSKSILVTAPITPTCSLAASMTDNIVPGDQVDITISITGDVPDSAAIAGQNVPVTGGTVSLDILVSGDIVGQLDYRGAPISCVIALSVMDMNSLTDQQKYRAQP